jgi:hypothetical protein
MVTFSIAVRTKSLANLREHWSSRHRRSSAEKGATKLAMVGLKLSPVLVVRMTRYGVRLLDDDNVRGALKAIRDMVAQRLRVDDASPLVAWEYAQATCKRGQEHVLVEIRRGE